MYSSILLQQAFQHFKMFKIKSILLLMLFLSVVMSIFTLIPRHSEDTNYVDEAGYLSLSVLVSGPVLFCIEILPPKGAVEMVLSRMHNACRGLLTVRSIHFVFYFLLHDQIRYRIGFILISQVLFYSLHDIDGVSANVIDNATVLLIGYAFVDVFMNDHLSAVYLFVFVSASMVIKFVSLGNPNGRGHTENEEAETTMFCLVGINEKGGNGMKFEL
ncbi:uncharacterized protein LOC141676732 [Apium graveolens]|uniref:uncharacterized protein LOC141676732 n=1 Tax=Apium graveolens TaxID=4045 RepID=UPI003D7B72B7